MFLTLPTLRKNAYSPASSGIAMKRLPIHEVAEAEAPNSLRNSMYRKPKLRVTPSEITLSIEAANTTNHPQPPSGMFGLDSWTYRLI